MASAAVESLQQTSSDEGFFLMVEGGRIDHGHHENFVKKAMEETIMLDKTVEVSGYYKKININKILTSE